jgi:hypothetical protein
MAACLFRLYCLCGKREVNDVLELWEFSEILHIQRQRHVV